MSYFKHGALIERLSTTVTSSGTLPLTVSSRTYQLFTGSQNHTVSLPGGSDCPVTRQFNILNDSTGLITVTDISGVVLTTVRPDTMLEIRVVDNTTPQGIWKYNSGSMGDMANRDDSITKAKVIDLTTTVLPTGASATIDGQVLVNNDEVLFANPLLNGLFRLSGVGTAIAWQQIRAFAGLATPNSNTVVKISTGTLYFATFWIYKNGTTWVPLETVDATLEPTGFVNQAQSTLSFVNGTRTFTVTPVAGLFDYFIQGRPFRQTTAQSIVLPNSDGVYYIYFNGLTLAQTSTFTPALRSQFAFVAMVHWSTVSGLAILFSDQRHNVGMQPAIQSHIYSVLGSALPFGTSGGFAPGNFTLLGAGSLDADAQLSVASGTLIDQDLSFAITHNAAPVGNYDQVLNLPAKIPVFYRLGVNGDWQKVASTNFPVKSGLSGRIQYNQNTGSAWQLTDATDGQFVSMFVFATSSKTDPIISVMGQQQSTSLRIAQGTDMLASLVLGILPVQEMKLLYRLTYQTTTTFSNTVAAALRDLRDFRAFPDKLVSPQDRASEVTVDTANFSGMFSPLDKDAQRALDTADAYFRQLQLREHPTNKMRVILTGATAAKSDGTTLIQPIDNNEMEFGGAVIDFSTGQIFQADGVTLLGTNFTPTVLGVAQYHWYSVSLTTDILSAQNRFLVKVSVSTAAADGATPAAAQRAGFVGKVKIGQVVVQESAGSITPIRQTAIEQGGVGSGAGGSGGDPSFQVSTVAGNNARLTGGSFLMDNGLLFVTGGGTTSTTTGAGTDLVLALDTVLGAVIANATTYYLYIDQTTLPAPVFLTDNGQKVINVTQPNFKLLTLPPDQVNPLRYVYVSLFRSANAGNSFSGVGSSFTSRPSKIVDENSAFFAPAQEFKATLTTAALQTLPHNLPGEPQLIDFYYVDLAGKKNGVDPQNVLITKDSGSVVVDTSAYVFGGGQSFIVEAFFIPRVQQAIAVPTHTAITGWFQNTATTLVAHGLTDMEDIRGYAVQEWNIVANTRRNLNLDALVKSFDNVNFNLDWTGLTPSATLQYRVVAGASALPVSIPIQFGGFNKFIGFGPGSYATITAAVTAMAPGDSLLVMKGYSISTPEVINVANIKIAFMPGVQITVTGGVKALQVQAAGVSLQNLYYLVNFAGTLTTAIEWGASYGYADNCFVEANNAGLTITQAYSILATFTGNRLLGLGTKATAGTISNRMTDLGSGNYWIVT